MASAGRKKKVRNWVYLSIGLLAVVLAGLAITRYLTNTNEPQTAGTTVHTITVGEQQRTYRLHRPASVPAGTKLPLVVMLHGSLGSGEQAESSYGWNAQADKEHFVVAYPDGFKRTWAVSGDCCGPAVGNGMNDVAFMVQMIGAIADEQAIDDRRIYAAGISNGGALAYRLACDTSVFAAIGVDAATLLGECPSPAPTSVIHIHGLDDQTFPYSGGPGKRHQAGSLSANTEGPAIPDLLAMWRKVDDCTAPLVTTSGVVTTTAAACRDGRAVTLVTIEGAGHQWPGATHEPRRERRRIQLDPPSTALNAAETIWQFFDAHSKE